MLKFNKSVYEWLCENKWKETTRKINNKVGRERESVCVFDSFFGLNTVSLVACFVNRGRDSAPHPLF